MLTIRLQRAGRKKLPMYRLVAQEHRRTPSSGKVAAYLGSYNPISKETALDVEKIEFYLKNGAQPSNKVAKLLQANKVKLPDWVKIQVRPEKAKPAPEAEAAPEAAASIEEPAAEAATEPKAETEPAAATETAVPEAPAAEEVTETPIEPEAEQVAEAPTKEAPVEPVQDKAEESAEPKPDDK